MSDDAEADAEKGGWWVRAECRGLTTAQRDDIFFPSRGDATAPAKGHLPRLPRPRGMPQPRLTHGEKFGIWGGMSERERRRLRHIQRINGEAAS